MNEISRINGINSDYVMGDGGKIEEVEGSPLFMRLFICPYRKPNRLKQKNGICSGIDTACPATTKTGHAMVELNQTEGIKLLADNGNELRVDQAGNILLNASGSVMVKNTFTINVANNAVSLEGPGGARIVMQSNGNIEIFTAGNAGDVTVRGNLKYTGTLAKI